MRHHKHNENYNFISDPIEFDKYTDRELLQYCLGATMYTPATRDIYKLITSKRRVELTSLVMCFEDAIQEEQVPEAEVNILSFFDQLEKAVLENKVIVKDLPLLIIRVRSLEQFMTFTARIKPSHFKYITAFNFPKILSSNARDYFDYLVYLNKKNKEILYGMPILESPNIVYMETRHSELRKMQEILSEYREYILNIRIGATDFSSLFGIRRRIKHTIYDIMLVRDALSDILNYFTRSNINFIVSAPVWEYFDNNEEFNLHYNENYISDIISHKPVFNTALDGLIREILMDKENGFIGKTIIHPTHIKYVNALYSVTKEEYEDALQILQTGGGVIKSSNNNKMNEINPHKSWAKKTLALAKVYGVVEDQSGYYELFNVAKRRK